MSFWKWDKKSRYELEAEHIKANTKIIRTFHQRFSLAAKCGITVFALLAFYLFWMRQGLFGVLVIVVVVGMIERVVHTEYRFLSYEDKLFLVIDHGRFSMNKFIPINEIIKCTVMKTTFGLSHYILVQYGIDKMTSVQPQNDDDFLGELKNLQEKIDNEIEP